MWILFFQLVWKQTLWIYKQNVFHLSNVQFSISFHLPFNWIHLWLCWIYKTMHTFHGVAYILSILCASILMCWKLLLAFTSILWLENCDWKYAMHHWIAFIFSSIHMILAYHMLFLSPVSIHSVLFSFMRMENSFDADVKICIKVDCDCLPGRYFGVIGLWRDFYRNLSESCVRRMIFTSKS